MIGIPESNSVSASHNTLDDAISGGIDFIDHDDIGHAQHRFARMMRIELMGTQRIDDDDVKIGPKEGEIVIATIPQNDICLGFRAGEDLAVIDSGIDDRSGGDMRLVLFAFLDRTVGGLQIGERLKPLRRLSG